MQQRLVSESLAVTINSRGAELCSVCNADGLEFMWQADEAIWPRHAPVLFPIVGKLKNNVYTWNNKPYTLSQHGFARDLEFSLVEQSNSRCTFELQATAETKKNYPFDFILRVSYALEQNRLDCAYQVFNSGKEPLLFSIGAHPGFNCPLGPNERFEDYYLEFETEHLAYTALQEGLRTHHRQALALSEKKLRLKSSLFDNDALVFEQEQVQRISLRSSRHQITMECAGWPYFGIWTKKSCDRFICLEPWFGVADRVDSQGALEKKEGMIRLGAGADFGCSYWMSFA